mmetsp:Transcript_130454/g.417393  ORF Transcript_130454/g.417393 Transcript_130454/m.417393 type:complete len:178 (+) Transcript_130454:391-924(+)
MFRWFVAPSRGTVEVTGAAFGLLGVLGAWHCKPSYIQWFNGWQMMRMAAWLFMYYVDIPLVLHCEGWVDAVEAMTQKYGWNDILYQVAMSGHCSNDRNKFFVQSTLTFMVFSYIVLATSRYQDVLSRVPKHLLRVPKDLSTGIYYAHSMGERSYINGTYGATDDQILHDKPPCYEQA